MASYLGLHLFTSALYISLQMVSRIMYRHKARVWKRFATARFRYANSFSFMFACSNLKWDLESLNNEMKNGGVLAAQKDVRDDPTNLCFRTPSQCAAHTLVTPYEEVSA